MPRGCPGGGGGGWAPLELTDALWPLSHVLYFDLKGHSGVMRSVYYNSCCFCLATAVLMYFVAFGSGLVWLISADPVTV